MPLVAPAVILCHSGLDSWGMQFVPKTATNPGGRVRSLAFDARTVSREIILQPALVNYM